MSRVLGLFALISTFLLFAAPASAQTYYGGTSPFEGAYVGGYAGGNFDPNASLALGGMAGVNFEVSPGIIGGLEVQGGADMKSGSTTWEAMMLARGGTALTPDAMVYGELGLGTIDGTTSWGVGAGAEAIVAPQIGARGDVLVTGPWGSGAARTKATAGLVWHLQ